jgi:site-specific recombinase XerC
MKTGETSQQRAKRNWKEYRRSTKERHAKGNPDAVQYLLGHSSLAYVQIYTQLQLNVLAIKNML